MIIVMAWNPLRWWKLIINTNQPASVILHQKTQMCEGDLVWCNTLISIIKDHYLLKDQLLH